MVANVDKSFLGTGWSFPPTFTRVNDSIVMVSDDRDIRESLWVLFSTSLGERIMLPTYGNQLWEMVFRGITTTLVTEIQGMVAQAILYWEPRITVDDIQVKADGNVDGLLLISVDYTIRKTNARSNLVYPFYTQGEQTIPLPPY
jgi:phage baseplate assembly protein W